MCGITGLFRREQPISERDETGVQHILRQLSYRGPDGSEIWKSGRCILGHRRLSIIDLSAAGAQPFELPDRGLVITFNGEIYNFKELREALSVRGYTFRSQSDTEVILLAYDCYGMEFLQHLRGMFAFCLLDQNKSKMVLARDPVGEKPLYFYFDSHRLAFSSEIKAFHGFPEVDLAIDTESVKAFFSLQYIPGANTIYRNIKRLPAGSTVELDLNTWQLNLRSYWSIKQKLNGQTTPEEIDALISESVKYRLVSDVEVGLLLSGGVDSALLASYADRNGSKLRAFTARFDEEDLDESEYARKVAEHLALEQIIITGGQLTPETFDQVIFHGDELLGDPACIPTFLLSKEISKYVKVVLSGEGADELFWGYGTYRLERIWRWFSWARNLFARPGFQEVVTGWETSPAMPPGLTRLGKVLSATYDTGASRWTSVFADHSLKYLVQDGNSIDQVIYLQQIEEQIHQLERYMDAFGAALSGDLLFWLADDLLIKVDRMTMAHSVEARAPYLDPFLILKALALPRGDKLRGNSGKFLLRELVEKHFPGSVGSSLAWRKKHGFEVPVNRWLKQNLRECVEERLSSRSLSKSGLLDVDFVTRLKDNFLASEGNTPLRRKVWMLLCFQTWYEWHEQGFGFR